MNTETTPKSVPRLAGLLLAGGALGFIIVFVFLAMRFGYPDVLDHPAAEVLPSLLAGGALLRVVWVVYALLPFTIVAAAWLARRRLGLTARADAATWLCGVVAGLAMTTGLSRWPTLQWALAEQWAAGAADTAALAARFDRLNLILGNTIGEFIGEVALAGWFLGVGYAMRARWVGRATLVLSALMLIGSFRNVIPLTKLATDVTNNLLPVVMIWVGVSWILGSGRKAAVAQATA